MADTTVLPPTAVDLERKAEASRLGPLKLHFEIKSEGIDPDTDFVRTELVEGGKEYEEFLNKYVFKPTDTDEYKTAIRDAMDQILIHFDNVHDDEVPPCLSANDVISCYRNFNEVLKNGATIHYRMFDIIWPLTQYLYEAKMLRLSLKCGFCGESITSQDYAKYPGTGGSVDTYGCLDCHTHHSLKNHAIL